MDCDVEKQAYSAAEMQIQVIHCTVRCWIGGVPVPHKQVTPHNDAMPLSVAVPGGQESQWPLAHPADAGPGRGGLHSPEGTLSACMDGGLGPRFNGEE